MFKTIIAIATLVASIATASAQLAAPIPSAPTAVPNPVDAAVTCLVNARLTQGSVEEASAGRVHFTVQAIPNRLGIEERVISFARGVRQHAPLKPAIDDCMKSFGAR